MRTAATKERSPFRRAWTAPTMNSVARANRQASRKKCRHRRAARAAERAKQDRAEAALSLFIPRPLPSATHSRKGDITASGRTSDILAGER